MKKPSEETMRKFVAFCDSGRPWYFFLGASLVLLVVQTALWLEAASDKKPAWWHTIPTWFTVICSVSSILEARKHRMQDAE